MEGLCKNCRFYSVADISAKKGIRNFLVGVGYEMVIDGYWINILTITNRSSVVIDLYSTN